MKYVEVILPLPLDATFTYSVPSEMENSIRPGMRLLVPLGRTKTYTAIAMRMHEEAPCFDTKPIISILDSTPMLLPEQLKLWQWISDYYMSPLGDIYKAALPSGLKAEEGYKPKTELYIAITDTYCNEKAITQVFDSLKRAENQQKAFATYLALSHWDSIEGNIPTEELKEVTREELMNVSKVSLPAINALVNKGFLFTYKVEVGRLDDFTEPNIGNIRLLNDAQQTAMHGIAEGFSKKDTVLLHGVTASGKTEIYIHLIQEAIDRGEQVLYLLPEIALTVQIMKRLKRVFGNRLGIYHSRYSDAERVEIWQKQLSDKPYDVILGARSAVFLPFKRLGLVVIDEEHETSYKQQDPAPRYHARSVAMVLARLYGAKTLLGTATPSMESYANSLSGKYHYVPLTTRHKGIELPEIHIVDTKDLRRRKMMNGPFSPQLINAMRLALEEGKQIILFQNRRGFSPMVECRTCGWVPKCDNCDVSLTLHRNMHMLTCHYCGYTYPLAAQCPACEGTDIRDRGFGTEKIEDRIQQIFPQARIARMDLDTTRTKNAYERIIDDFAHYRTDILIGTQMISKGLDFERVSLVGILDADAMLNQPDFRANEHTFMMLSQVAGRAGRRGQRGQVIMQTRSAELPVIKQIVDNDYEAFYKDCSEERRLFRYPPFYRLIYVYLKHSNDNIVDGAAIEMAGRLRSGLANRVLGPDKPAVARVKNQCLRKIMIKLEAGLNLQQVRAYIKEAQRLTLSDKRYAAVSIFFDVDPS